MSPYDRNPANRRRIILSVEERRALHEGRQAKGLRLKILARKLRVSPSAVSHWLAGDRRPTPEQLQIWREAVLL